MFLLCGYCTNSPQNSTKISIFNMNTDNRNYTPSGYQDHQQQESNPEINKTIPSTTSTPAPTTESPPLSSVPYIAGGVAAVCFLFAVQTCIIIFYVRKAKGRRDIYCRSRADRGETRNNEPRYSMQPESKKPKKANKVDDDTYESLDNVQRDAPEPPPIATIPSTLLRIPVIPVKSPASTRVTTPPETRNQILGKEFKSTSSINSIQNRGRMPLPHEMSNEDDHLKMSTLKEKPSMPLFNLSERDVTTLPSRNKQMQASVQFSLTKKTINLSTASGISKSQEPSMDTELMEKLRKRAEMNEAGLNKQLNTISQSPDPVRHLKPKHVAPPPLRKPQPGRNFAKTAALPPTPPGYKAKRNPRDSYSSDDDWTIEPIKPINIYNI